MDRIWSDFESLCGFGGRLSGSPGERSARAFLAQRLAQIAHEHGGQAWSEPLPFTSWRPLSGQIGVPGWADTWGAVPMLRSPAAETITGSVVDLGRGTHADFDRHRDRLFGALALVRHEYMFATDHCHRTRKYQAAVDAGAAALLVAGLDPGLAVTGGVGGISDETEAPIPAVGLAPETAVRLSEAGSATLHVEIDREPAVTENLFLDLPGGSDRLVVLSAHIDGHAIGQSAMDNASGLAAVLSATEVVAPFAARARAGLRIAFFSLEEWGLIGSMRHVEGLSSADRDRLVAVINLDAAAGDMHLTAVTGGNHALGNLLATVAGDRFSVHSAHMANSDHHNFHRVGIPACRLVAGFDRPGSRLRHVLTEADTIDKVAPAELQRAAAIAAEAAGRLMREPDLVAADRMQGDGQ